MLLLFTVNGPARAQEARSGPTLRAGSAVGFVDLFGERYATLGGQVAIGYHLGPLVLEADYESLAVLEYVDGGNQRRGTLGRSGVSAHWMFASIGPDSEKRSLLRLFVSAALGLSRGELEGSRLERADVGGGGGWLLDHHFLRRPRLFPATRIGWHFGWRVAASPGPEPFTFLCKGKRCGMPPPPRAAWSLGVSSSLSVSF